jgi:alpha-galactosidase
MKIKLLCLITALPLLVDSTRPIASEPAVAPSMEEMARASQWTLTKFQGRELPNQARRAELLVAANHDPVQINSRNGKPLFISGQTFTRGLYCHAPSKVIVRLPGPGEKFQALAGVDSNQDTSGGRGSVVFTVGVGGKQLYTSGLMREGMSAKPVEANLDGALELTLEVGDGGDGISCDQADWADARVTMKDGSVLWLGSLPFAEDAERPLSTEPPFSFSYGGKPSRDFLKNWTVERTAKELDASRTEHTTVYSDPGTGLKVRCAGVAYKDFPTVEWTLHFSNTGASATPVIENIQPLDASFERNRSGEFTLHHFRGTTVAASDLEPLQTILQPASTLTLASTDGRPCSTTFPYFNIHSSRASLIVAVGWPGQWSASLVRDAAAGLRVRAGQQLTHFKLHPGEDVRSPLIVLQFYSGDWIRSQNIWRRWMIAHNVPRPGGELPKPIFTPCSSHQYAEMTQADEASQKTFIDRYIEEGLKPDYWWMDAGWYKCDGSWPKTGTWEVDDKRFPRGLRAVSDYAHGKSVKTIVWFEPERVASGTWLAERHPEWLLKSSPKQPDGENRLLNLGDSDAFRWLVEHIDGIIKAQGIDLYRQDYNIGPLAFWRNNDAEDRQGITEIKYVTGYLAYWDELIRRNPNLLIDSCASGGHRNDLETMRRAVPLLRSDYIFEPIGQQCHTYGHAFWLPFFGTGNGALDPYTLRSAMCNNIIGCWDLRRKDLDYALLRRLFAQWREVSQEYYGDYYPLTPYSLAADSWIAWQFNRPEVGKGVVQAYRRQDSFYESARLRLFGLDPAKTYSVRNLDATVADKISGKELADKGLLVSMPDKPGSAWITYSAE